MPAPTILSIVCDEIYITVTFSEAVSSTVADVGGGFSVSVDAAPVDIVSATLDSDEIQLQVPPIREGQTVLLSLDNTPAYLYDDATDTDAVADFTDSAVTNNSSLTTTAFDSTMVYAPALDLSEGTVTASVEIELSRSDRLIVEELGALSVGTAYTYTGGGANIDVLPLGSTSPISNGTVLSASLSAATIDNANALTAWQALVRDNVLTAILQARELASTLGIGSTTGYRL